MFAQRLEWISFDAAGTLIEVRYRPGKFARSCCEAIGEALPPEAERVYDALVVERREAFCDANLTRDPAIVDGFWRDLTAEWAHRVQFPVAKLEAVREEAERQMYHSDRWFKLFPDAIPALERARAMGYRTAILSNWDLSLQRLVQTLGLAPYVEFTIASLEEGPEKPDPALFQVLLDRAGAAPDQVLHLGDSPTDDVEGALRSGLHAGYLRREFPLRRVIDQGPPALLHADTLTGFLDLIP